MTDTVLPEVGALVGLDWARDKHDVAVQIVGQPTIEFAEIAHTPEDVSTWLRALATRCNGRPIAIALETSRGPIVHAVLELPNVVLYPVNPRSLARYREVFSPNGSKDDQPDAALLLSLLLNHRDRLTAWMPDDAQTRTLRALVEQRRRFVDWRRGFVQSLQDALRMYYPAAHTLAGEDLSTPMACAFLRQWPTFEQVKRARPTTLRTFYRRHRCRNAARIDERIAHLASAQPLTTDPAIIGPYHHLMLALVTQLEAMTTHIDALDAMIATEFAAHPDAPLFADLPGAGATFAPRLLVALGTNRDRFPAAAAVQQHAGIAPVTKRSGKSQYVEWRWATSTFVRQSFHEFAQYSLPHCRWAKAYYAEQRRRGKSHHAAVRALAFKWIRIIWRCWYDRTPYDDARYEQALRTRGSRYQLPIQVLEPA